MVCCSSPILEFSNFDQTFTLEMDVLEKIVATVLMQYHDGHKASISAVTKALTPAENNYSTIEKAAGAVVWEACTFDHTCMRPMSSLKQIMGVTSK